MRSKEQLALDYAIESKEILMAVIFQLERLAKAFSVVGNHTMSRDLFCVVEQINKAEKLIDKSSGLAFGASLENAQIFSSTILESVLAGIALVKKEKG